MLNDTPIVKITVMNKAKRMPSLHFKIVIFKAIALYYLQIGKNVIKIDH